MNMEFKDLVILIILIASIAMIFVGVFVDDTQGIIQLGSGILAGILFAFGITVKLN